MSAISVEKMGTIDAGRQGENLARTIEFDVSTLLAKWPGATITLLVKRKGDADPYFAEATVEGHILKWPITEVETAVAGDGKIEIQAILGEVIEKSVTATFRVSASLSGSASEDLPEVRPSWVDEVLAAADGGKTNDLTTLMVVTVEWDSENSKWVADKSYGEINDAVRAGKVVIANRETAQFAYYDVDDGGAAFYRVFHGETAMAVKTTAIIIEQIIIKADGTVTLTHGGKTTPNPCALTLMGAVEAAYDGSEAVTVEIPSGIADPGTAHQQLVSDAEGKAVWVPALAYKTTGQVEVLPETALTHLGEEDGIQTHALMSPLPTMLEEGKTYTVNYNGTDYACPVVSADGGLAYVLGNASAIGGEGGNADAPFCFIAYNDAETVESMGGIYVMCAALDGATSVTISITGEGTTYKTIDEPYLPKGVVRKPVTLTIAADGTVTSDTSFIAAWAMGLPVLNDSIVIKQELGAGTQTITPANVELFENSAGVQYIYIRYSSRMYDMLDNIAVPDLDRWIFWTSTTLERKGGFIPGFNPSNLRASGTAEEGDYVRYSGNGLLQLAAPSQVLEDLGFLTVTVTLDGSTYTADKTHDEVLAAVQAGKHVRAIIGGAVLQCDGQHGGDNLLDDVLFHSLYKGVFYILTYKSTGLTMETKSLS